MARRVPDAHTPDPPTRQVGRVHIYYSIKFQRWVVRAWPRKRSGGTPAQLAARQGFREAQAAIPRLPDVEHIAAQELAQENDFLPRDYLNAGLLGTLVTVITSRGQEWNGRRLVYPQIQVALNSIGDTQGSLLYRDATAWHILTPGTAGEVLTSGGAGENPSWGSTTGDVQELLDQLSPAEGSLIIFDGDDWVLTDIETLLAESATIAGIETDIATLFSLISTGAVVGYNAYAYPQGWWLAAAPTVALNLAANGGTLAVPMDVSKPMLLQALTIETRDTTLARSAEWRLYLDTNASGVLNEVAGANGTWSYTATAALPKTSNAAGAPVALQPGIYWLAIRNTHASNTFGVGVAGTAATLQQTFNKIKTIGSALGSTLDFITGWAASALPSTIAGAMLEGRIFGRSTGGW